jgi:hypothetical protein
MRSRVNPQTQELLKESFPRLFQKNGTTYPVHEFGIECEDGWNKIVENLLQELEEYDVTLAQVKQKFGELRVYLNYGEKIDPHTFKETTKILNKYKDLSDVTCEKCGHEGTLHQTRQRWLSTVCDTCASAYDLIPAQGGGQ